MSFVTPVLNVDTASAMKSFDVAQASGGDLISKTEATGGNEGLMSVKASDLESVSSVNPMNEGSFGTMMSGVFNRTDRDNLDLNLSEFRDFDKESNKVDEIKRSMTPEFEVDSSEKGGYDFGSMLEDYEKLNDYKNFGVMVIGVASSVSKSVKMLIRQG